MIRNSQTAEGLLRVANELDPALRKVGFRRNHLRWNRPRASFVDVVELQLGKAGVPGREQFTLNAGAFIPSFAEVVWQKKHSGFAKEVDCAVRARPDEILRHAFSGDAHDVWWHLQTKHDAELVARELNELISTHLIPFLDKFQSYDDIRQFLVARTDFFGKYPLTRIYLALAQWATGYRDPARRTLQETAATSGAWSERATSVQSVLERGDDALFRPFAISAQPETKAQRGSKGLVSNVSADQGQR